MMRARGQSLIFSALETVARGLSAKYGITVSFEGATAYTDGRRIVLPQISEELTADELDDIRGYLYHETAHCIFSDFGVFEQAARGGQIALKILTNFLEDIRIERAIAARYGGTEHYIERLRGRLNQKNLAAVGEASPFMLMGFALAESMRGQRHGEIDRHEIGPLVKTLAARYTGRLNQAPDTSTIRDIAAEILEDVRRMAAPFEASQSPQPPQPPQSGEGQSGEGQSGEGAKAVADDMARARERDDGGGDERADRDGRGAPDNHSMNGEGARGFGSVEDMMNEQFKAIIERMNRGEKGSGRNHHNEKIDPTAGRQSIPSTTRFDEEISFEGDHSHDELYGRIRAKILMLASGVRGRIERALAARETERRDPLQKRGKLDRRKLARFATDKDFDRPFYKINSSVTGRSAVTILVDLSGSMSGAKIDAARQAAAVMAEALRGLSIPFEVLGFECVGDDRMSKFSRGLSSDSRFNRTEEILSHKIFKSFDGHSLSGIAAIESGANNADGESLMWAARRLAERRESRKILIVLSDGNPVAQGDQRVLYDDLKTKIARVEASGIECVGIGVTTDVVKKFYKDFVVLERVSDLVTGCGQKLAEILLKNQSRMAG